MTMGGRWILSFSMPTHSLQQQKENTDRVSATNTTFRQFGFRFRFVAIIVSFAILQI